MSAKKIRVGLLGFGTVGSAVFDLIGSHQVLIQRKTECEVSVEKICVKDLKKKRRVDSSLITNDYKSVVNDPHIDVIIELMGDCDEAYQAMKLALSLGKPVVTANKAILAKHGLELFQTAENNDTEILFEASVAGGIPILRTLREGITCNRIMALKGIINGTANFILSEMTNKGVTFEDALKIAQDKGYAEADPSSDILGTDAAYKLVILIMLCHGRVISVDQVFTRGIAYIKPIDIEIAKQFGYVIKLLGITKEDEAGFEARVHPTMIPKTHPLAHVDGANNAISYLGDYVGEGMQYGLGAGGGPTASAVVSDLIEVSRREAVGNTPFLSATGFEIKYLRADSPKDILNLEMSYYIRFSVFDRPNVLAQITRTLGEHKISVKHLYQHGAENQTEIPLIVFTHKTPEASVRKALKEIDQMDFISQITKLIRIEE